MVDVLPFEWNGLKLNLIQNAYFIARFEQSYPWLVTINYITSSLPVGKCMCICSKFQRKNNEVRIEELYPNTKLQFSKKSCSNNITLIQYMDRFKALNILIHH